MKRINENIKMYFKIPGFEIYGIRYLASGIWYQKDRYELKIFTYNTIRF
jgi:hypothetical protein